jgi:hypothetical protein
MFLKRRYINNEFWPQQNKYRYPTTLNAVKAQVTMSTT